MSPKNMDVSALGWWCCEGVGAGVGVDVGEVGGWLGGGGGSIGAHLLYEIPGV